MFAGLVGGVGRLAEVLTASITAAGADVVLDAAVRELARLPAGWRLVTGSAASPKTINADAVVLALPATPAGAAASRNGTVGRAGSHGDRLREHGGRYAGLFGVGFRKTLYWQWFPRPGGRRQADQGCDVLDGQVGLVRRFGRRAGALFDRAPWRRRRSPAVRRRVGCGRCARSRGRRRRPRGATGQRSSLAGAVPCRSTASAISTGSLASRRHWPRCPAWWPAERHSTESEYLRALPAVRQRRPRSSRSCSARENRRHE